MRNYSDDEKRDITERVTKASELLKELQLTPSAQVMTSNIGDDVFGTKVVCYLQDTKYTDDVPPTA